MTRPQIRVSVDSYKGPKRAQADGASADDREVVATEIRNHSGGDAPNFFQTLSLIVDMPEDRIFCPTLRIDVWDHRPLHAVLVGTAFVPLEDRLPQMAPWVVESDLQAVVRHIPLSVCRGVKSHELRRAYSVSFLHCCRRMVGVRAARALAGRQCRYRGRRSCAPALRCGSARRLKVDPETTRRWASAPESYPHVSFLACGVSTRITLAGAPADS